jgi:hypothetical protein
MSAIPESLDKLEQLAHELERRGEASIAKQITREVATLRTETAPPELMTLDDATRALGLTSSVIVSHWARIGKLERYRQNGQVLVTARSVAALAESPIVARQIEWERELEEALAPFTFDDIDPSEFGDTWVGRKPWATGDPA